MLFSEEVVFSIEGNCGFSVILTVVDAGVSIKIGNSF